MTAEVLRADAEYRFAELAFTQGMRVKDTGNKRFTPLPPANAEARAAAMDWTPEEDKQLFIFARQYSFNWDLIASVFNDATHRLKCDERLPWDCYDHWHKKYAPLPTPATGQASAATALPPTTAQATTAEANGQPIAGQMEQQQAQAQANNSQKKDKRSASATLASSTSASVPVKRPELSRAQIRHMSIIEATKKVQRKRELMQKNSECLTVFTFLGFSLTTATRSFKICNRLYARSISMLTNRIINLCILA